jgi:ketosteroid isomerase-like protein
LSDPEFEAAVHEVFRAFSECRFGDFAAHMAPDIVETFPQSGERIEGRDRQRAGHEAFPNPPNFTVRKIRRSGDLAVVEVDEHYADGTVWNDVFILELRDGLVASMTVYFGQPFDAPDWRAPFRVSP